MAILSSILGSVLSAVGDTIKGAKSAPSSRSSAPTVTMPTQTARQRMLAQEEDDDDRWYKGAEPTQSEIIARIYTIGKNDPKQGEQLWNAFSTLSSDPTCPIYNPYSRATNKAVSEMAALGYDMSGGVTEDWLKANSGLMAHYRTGTSGTPLSPSSKSTKEQNAAYWYYQILGDEERTQKAENEWAALQEEITYWTQRKDRNYSDQEILDRIDWSSYKTLTDMDEARRKGVPLALNRAVGYSQDALAGVIWAARNGGSTGNPMIDSVKAALGQGNSWQQNEEISARLDPMSDKYNPYAVGATIDEEALYFSVDSFDSKWLEENRGYLASRDKTAREFYGKVYDAEQNTLKAEQEVGELWRRIEYGMQYSNDPDRILEDVLEGGYTDERALSKLMEMDESLKSGNIMAMTRAVDYRWQDVEAEVRRRCREKEAAMKGSEYVQNLAGSLGLSVPSVSSNDAINASRDIAIGSAGSSIAQNGTEAEKIVWKNAYSADYETYISQIQDAIANGITDAQGGYDYALSRANDYAGKNYMDARKNGDMETLLRIREGYDIADRLAAFTGAMEKEAPTTMTVLNHAYRYGGEYRPTEWEASDLYSEAIAQGHSYEETAAAAQAGAQAAKAEIEKINETLQYLSDHSIVLDRQYIENMEREKARLERNVKDAEYFALIGQGDFASVVQNTRDKVSTEWNGLKAQVFGSDTYSPISAAIVNPVLSYHADERHYAQVMTDTEKDIYLYILGTQGQEEADRYFSYLADPYFGVLPVRESKEQIQTYSTFAQEHPVAGGILSVIASPSRAIGGAYAAYATIKDGEINPNHPFMAGVNLSDALGENSLESLLAQYAPEGGLKADLISFGYEAIKGAGESLISASIFGPMSIVQIGMGGMASTGLDVQGRGGSREQILLSMGASFLAESITEKLTYSNIRDALKMPSKEFKSFMRKMLFDMAEEGAGEGASELLNSVSDELIMGELSNRRKMITAYTANGMTQEEAEKQAFLDIAANIGYAAAVGAASGGVSTGVAGIAGRMLQHPGDASSSEPQNELQDAPDTTDEETSTPAEETPTQAQDTAGEEDQFPIQAPDAEVMQGEETVDNVEKEEQARTARAVNALTQALETADESSRTATIAAVLAPQEADAGKQAATNAAAQYLSERYGSEKAVSGMRRVTMTAAESSIRADRVNDAIAVAALSEGEAGAMLDTVMQNPTAESLVSLIEAADRDADNPDIAVAIQKATLENKIAMREKQLIAEGASSGIASYETGVAQAKANVRAAKSRLQRAQREQTTSGQNLQTVNAQFTADPTNEMLRGATQQAIKDVEGKALMTAQAEQGVISAQDQLSEAEKTLETMRASTMKQIREQAQQDVLAEIQAQEQAEANRAAQKRAEAQANEDARMDANVNAMDAETFIEQNYKDSSEEQKNAIRKIWNRIADKTPMKVTRDIIQFAARVEKKFGVKIDFVDSLDGVRRGEITGNRIKVARDSTTGDVVRSVILHELTHKAEGGGKLYDRLSQMILDMKYQGDQAAMDADIDQKVADYSAYYKAQNRTDVFGKTEARQEIVADFFGDILNGNEAMIERLVRDDYTLAQRISNLIRDVLDKLTGVKDPQIDQMKKAVRMLDKAIRKADKAQGGTKYMITQDESNWPIVKADRNFVLSEDKKQWGKQIRQFIRDEIRNHGQIKIKTLDGDEIILDKNSQEKARDWLANADAENNRVRKNASAHLDEVVAVSEDVDRGAPNTPDEKGNHLWAKDGWRYREAVFENYDGKRYLLTLSVGVDGENRTVYNIGDVDEIKKKDSAPVNDQQGRVPSGRAETSESPALRRLDPSDAIISENAADINRNIEKPEAKYSLPSDNALEAQIRAWMQEHQAEIDAAVEEDGVSRQPDRIIQNPYIPEAARQVIDSNPIFRSYKKDSNAAQFDRAMDSVRRNGYQEEVERLLDADYLGTDDSVEAGALAIAAFESGDGATALSLMAKNELAVREAARTMQATQAFAKMSPTHVMAQIGGEMEIKLTDMEREYGALAEDVKRIARENDLKLSGLRGGDELAKLNEQSSFSVPDNKWGVPINEKQQYLIDKYKLNNVARPGLNYNRASTKQRMLEAILMTPEPDADTGNGHTLTERLAWMKKGKPVATMADLQYIADRIAEYVKYSGVDKDSREAKMALARALEAYGNITPLTNYQKLRTQRFVNMLLSVPSALRNVIGNSMMNAVTAATHDTLGILTDAVTSVFTGKRTQAMIDMKARADGWHAFVEETKNTFRDYFIDKVDTSVVDKGDNKFDQKTRGRAFEHSMPEFARNVEGFLMSVGDRNFWKKAYFNSLAEQQSVAQKNGLELDWNKAVEQAKADADYSTFNEDSKVRDLLSQARQIPGLGFVMDMIMPFTGVPTNITKRMVEYSPIGLGWSFIKHAWLTKAEGGNFDQKSFVNGVSRGLSGTMLFAIGLGLKELGLIDLGTGEEDDEKIYNLGAAQGKQYSPFIRIGDEYVSLAAFAPSISPIIMGAMAYESFQNDDDLLTALKNAVVSAGDQIFDASYMSGLSDLFDQNGSFFENAANTLAKNAISQNMPYNALLNRIATGLDPYVRDTKDKDFIMQALKSGAITKIPIVREWALNPKYDITGSPVPSKEGVIRNLLDPLTTTEVNDDPALQELKRIQEATGSSSHIPTFLIKTSGKVQILAAIADERNVNMDRANGENNLVLNADERNHYNQLYGTLAFDGTGDTVYRTVGKGVEGSFTGIRDYMNSYEYQNATDGERAKKISEINKKAKLLTQAQIVIDKGYVTSLLPDK